MGRHFFNILIALNHLLNALLAGDPDESVSSYHGEGLERRTRAFWVLTVRENINALCLPFAGRGHCIKSLAELEARQAMSGGRTVLKFGNFLTFPETAFSIGEMT